MTSNLKSYKLTPKGIVSPVINIPANYKTGDVAMRFITSSLTDAKAEILLSRKDGRGAAFVEKAPSSSPSAVSSTKK